MQPTQSIQETPKITTGSSFLDQFLQGGYDADIITTIFGPSGSGKTNLCLLTAVKVAETGKKVIFIDTEGGIAVERIKQLSVNHETVLNNIVFLIQSTSHNKRKFLKNLKVISPTTQVLL